MKELALVLLATAAFALAAYADDPADPARLPAPPADAAGFPSRAPDLDALPGFVNPPPGYGEVPYWWWTGDPLDRQRLLWQLDLLHAKGIAGVQINYAHDTGMTTYPVEPPIFSKEWWATWQWLAGECRKRGMGIGLSGYTLDWPGRHNLFYDQVLTDPALRGMSLQQKAVRAQGGKPLTLDLPEGFVSASAFQVKGGALDPDSVVDLRPQVQGQTLSWTPPAGEWQVFLLSAPPRDRTLDPMNPAAGKTVIEKFFQPFAAHCPGDAGNALNYFFQDELSFGVGGWLWTAQMPEEFRKRKGYDVMPLLPALFTDLGPKTPKIRLDYSDVMVALTEERYFQPIFEWNWKRGMIYACDPSSRGGNPHEFGDYFRTVRWYSAPGHDTPGRSADLRKDKVSSSIAHLYQRPRVWLEGYHSLGWGATPATIFKSTCDNFLYGANLLNLHGLYYTTHGGYWEWAPPCFHWRMPYWDHMGGFLKYMERLSYLVSQGVHRCDVAILYPVAPFEAGMGGNEAAGAAFGTGSDLYLKHGFDFDYMDFQSLARAKVEQKALHVSGETYRALILPAMAAVRHSTLEQALALFRAGGIVIATQALPEASDAAGRDDPQLDAMVKELFGLTAREAKAGGTAPAQTNAAGGLGLFTRSMEEIAQVLERGVGRDFAGPAGAHALHRKIGPRNLYMVSDAPRNAECTFRARGRVELWDPWTGKTQPVYVVSQTPDGTRVRLPGNPDEPRLVLFTPGDAGPTLADTDLDEVASVGAGSVTGYADTPGLKRATLRVGDKEIVLKGEAPAAPAPLTIEGPWEFALKPTLDNRWGDFRLPITDKVIGAEARRFRWAQETAPNPGWQAPEFDDSRWPQVTCSFGPRFWKLGPLPADADTAALEAKLAELKSVDPAAPVEVGGKQYRWQAYDYSTRWGIEGDPGPEGYHGLKEMISDEFIALGAPQYTGTQINYNAEPVGTRYYLWTAASTACDGQAHLLAGGKRPAALWLNGAALKDAAGTVPVKAGANPLLLRYDGPGRGYFLLSAKPGASAAADQAFSQTAHWIWYPGDSEAVGDRFFRKEFKLARRPAKARLRICGDDGYTLFVNGQNVGDAEQWTRIQEYDVARFLKPGINVLAVVGRNGGGSAGLVAELVAGSARVATDTSWRASRQAAAGWKDAGFDDAQWAAAESLGQFARGMWYTHQMGPPQLDAPAPEKKASGALAMRWYNDPNVLPFDARPQDAQPAGWYRFTAPPGLRAMRIIARGRVQAWADGRPLQVPAGKRLPDGTLEYRVAVAQPSTGMAKVALRVEQERGCYGGAALPEPVALDCGPGLMELGDWSQKGALEQYSGGAWYRKTVTLAPEQARGPVMLDLGDVVASAEVRINGKPAGVRVTPPWRLDVSSLVKPGENRIEVLVCNTLANHYSTLPTHYRGDLKSGLIGPVRIVTQPMVVLKP